MHEYWQVKKYKVSYLNNTKRYRDRVNCTQLLTEVLSKKFYPIENACDVCEGIVKVILTHDWYILSRRINCVPFIHIALCN